MFPPMSATIVAATIFVAADQVPNWNVEPSCRLQVGKTTLISDMKVCMDHEREARAQLVREWNQFAAADKAHCLRLSSLGGEPSYADLVTCLELQRDARNLREKEGATVESQEP
jgi:hypothetical protein